MSKFLVYLSAFCLVAMTTMMIVGIATPYWISRPGFYSGLWKYCNFGTIHGQPATCIKLDIRPDFEDWINAVRVLVLLAVSCSGIAFLLLLVYMCQYDGHRNLVRIRAVISLILMAVFLCTIGIVVYAAKQTRHTKYWDYNYGWSFIVTTTFGAALLLVTVPLGCEIRHSRRLGAYESI